MASGNDVKSLAQGIVYWGPPKEALNAAKDEAEKARYCQYGPDEGMPELREALKHKLKEENGLTEVRKRVSSKCLLAAYGTAYLIIANCAQLVVCSWIAVACFHCIRAAQGSQQAAKQYFDKSLPFHI